MTSAVFLEQGSLARGMKWAIFEKQSTNQDSHFAFWRWQSGQKVHGDVGPWLLRKRQQMKQTHLVLFQAQTVQAATYSVTAFFVAGHQNCCLMMYMDLMTAGWHVSMDVWAQWTTLERNDTGTNKQLCRHPLGAGLTWTTFACFTFSSTVSDKKLLQPYNSVEG